MKFSCCVLLALLLLLIFVPSFLILVVYKLHPEMQFAWNPKFQVSSTTTPSPNTLSILKTDVDTDNEVDLELIKATAEVIHGEAIIEKKQDLLRELDDAPEEKTVSVNASKPMKVGKEEKLAMKELGEIEEVEEEEIVVKKKTNKPKNN